MSSIEAGLTLVRNERHVEEGIHIHIQMAKTSVGVCVCVFNMLVTNILQCRLRYILSRCGMALLLLPSACGIYIVIASVRNAGNVATKSPTEILDDKRGPTAAADS